MPTRSSTPSRKRKAEVEGESRSARKQKREEQKALARQWAEAQDSTGSTRTTTTPTKSPARRRVSTGGRAAKKPATRRRRSTDVKPPAKEEEESDEEDSPLPTPSRKKRKLTHNDNEAPVLSKKEIREQQKARADAWAASQNSSAVEPQPAAKRSPPKSASSPSSRRTRNSNVLKETPFSSPTRLKTPAIKVKKAAAAVVPSPPPPARVNVHTLEPPVRVVKEDEDYTTMEQQHEEALGPAHRQSSFRTLSLVALVTAVLAGIVGVMVQHPHGLSDLVSSISSVFTSVQSSPLASQPKLPPCYETNAESLVDEAAPCDDSNGIMPCPERGVCWGNKLRACDASYLGVSDTGDGCVLSKDANATLDSVKSVLERVNVQERCYVNGGKDAIYMNGVEYPMVDVHVVLEQVDVSLSDLLDMIESYSWDLELLESDVGETLVGLSVDYLDEHFRLPVWCYMNSLFIMLVEVLWGSVASLCLFAVDTMYGLTIKYPIPVLVCATILWISYYRRKRRRAALDLLNDVANVRELAYAFLQENRADTHVVLHVRDTVAHGLYPTSKSKRSRLVKTVWPRVVSDVERDNRVGKTCRMVDGKPRDIWQWKATPSKRRVQFGKN